VRGLPDLQNATFIVDSLLLYYTIFPEVSILDCLPDLEVNPVIILAIRKMEEGGLSPVVYATLKGHIVHFLLSLHVNAG
jgi:hypothetical protein